MRINPSDLTKLTFAAAAELMGHATRKIISNNTILERLSDITIGVRLYQTIVVEIHACGNYTLYSGGYMTPTTKQRINALSPANVHQTRGVWYVGSTPFAEGIIVNPAGEVAA